MDDEVGEVVKNIVNHKIRLITEGQVLEIGRLPHHLNKKGPHQMISCAPPIAEVKFFSLQVEEQ